MDWLTTTNFPVGRIWVAFKRTAIAVGLLLLSLKAAMLLMGPWVLEHTLSKQAVRDVLVSSMKDNTGLSLTMADLSLQPTLFHGVRTRLKSPRLAYKSTGKTHTVMKAHHVDMFVAYPDFLQQPIRVSGFHFDRADLRVDPVWVDPLMARMKGGPSVLANHAQISWAHSQVTLPYRWLDPHQQAWVKTVQLNANQGQWVQTLLEPQLKAGERQSLHQLSLKGSLKLTQPGGEVVAVPVELNTPFGLTSWSGSTAAQGDWGSRFKFGQSHLKVAQTVVDWSGQVWRLKNRKLATDSTVSANTNFQPWSMGMALFVDAHSQPLQSLSALMVQLYPGWRWIAQGQGQLKGVVVMTPDQQHVEGVAQLKEVSLGALGMLTPVMSHLNSQVKLTSTGWQLNQLSAQVAQNGGSLQAQGAGNWTGLEWLIQAKAPKVSLQALQQASFALWPLLPRWVKQETLLLAAQGTGSLEMTLSRRQGVLRPLIGSLQLHPSQLYRVHPSGLAMRLATIQGRVASGDGKRQDLGTIAVDLVAALKQSRLALHGQLNPEQNWGRIQIQAPALALQEVDRTAKALWPGFQWPAFEPQGGTLAVDVLGQGPLDRLDWTGLVQLKQLKGQFSRLQGATLSQVNGGLRLGEGQVRLEQFKGLINAFPFQLLGQAALDGSSYQAHFKSQGLALAQVVDALQQLRYIPTHWAAQSLKNYEEDLAQWEGAAQESIASAVGVIGTSEALAGEKAAEQPTPEANPPKPSPSDDVTPLPSKPLINKSLLDRMTIQSGTMDLDLSVDSRHPNVVSGQVQAHRVKLQWPGQQQPIPIDIDHLTYDVATGHLEVGPNQQIQVMGIPMHFDGRINTNDYDLEIALKELPLSWIRDNQPTLQSLFPWYNPSIYQAKGALSFKLHTTPSANQWSLAFHDAGVSVAQLKFPIYHVNGQVNFSVTGTQHPQWALDMEQLSLHYGNSPMELYGQIRGKEDIYLETRGTISPLLINQILAQNHPDLLTYAELPFEINASGRLGDWFGQGHGNDLAVFIDINPTSILTKSTHPVAEADQTHWSSVFRLKGNELTLEKTTFGKAEGSQIVLSGWIKDIFDPLKASLALRLKTDPVLELSNIGQQLKDAIFQQAQGQVTTDLTLAVSPEATTLMGKLDLNQVSSVPLHLQELTAQLNFMGEEGTLNIDHFKIPGVDLKASGLIPDVFQYPVPIADMKGSAEQFIVPLFNQWVEEALNQQIRKGLWEAYFSRRSQLPLPFYVENGSVDLKELIIGNLIMKNFSAQMKMYANAFLEFEQFSAESADGKVSGRFAIQPNQNNFMSVHVFIDHMKANAVIQTLLGTSNQLFGDLSGTIDFTTEGQNPKDMTNHVNGFADLKVEDGRMPNMAYIERLLVAANTLSGGLANLNLNSIFRLAGTAKSDYFADMSGTFNIADGVIYTNDLKTNGDNLDLAMHGNARLVDGYTDMSIRGQMNRDISGSLGAVGKLSLGRVLGVIPPLRTLINYIPGIGFIPGFGGPPKVKSGVSFEVDVKGPANEPGSLQNFRWVR